jgi:pimeloyl-ACP methyl ester carboxylesterase
VGTVVCVHGALDGASSFLRLARRLADCDVVTYDRRGYRSSRGVPVRAGLAVQVDDLLDVLGAVPEAAATRCVVLGHSFGGLVALGAARERGRSAAIDAVVAYEPPFPWGSPATRHAGATSEDPAVAAEAFFRRIVGDAAWDRLSEHDKDVRRADGHALIEDLRVLGTAQPFEPSDVEVPVAIGLSDDAPDRRRASSMALADALPRGRLVLFSSTGHGAHLSSPGRLAELVRAQLEVAAPG